MSVNKEKKPTIYDIAKALGVSSGTVNRALHNKAGINPETKRRVLKKVEEMNFKPNSVAQSMRRKTFKMAVIECCAVVEFSQSIREGIRNGLEQIGEFNIIGYRFEFLNPNNIDFSNDIEKLVNQLIEDDVDGVILLTGNDNEGMKSYVLQMQKEGIMVACVTSRITGVDTPYVGIDSVGVGKLAGEILNLCDPGGKVGILIGTDFMTPHKGYLEGFRKVNQDCPFEYIDVYTHFDDAKQVENQTLQMIKEHPDLSSVYIATASSITALRVINEVCPDKGLNIIATDLFAETKEYLTNRFVKALIFQDPFLQGKIIAELAYKHLCGDTKEKEIILKPKIVFPSDII